MIWVELGLLWTYRSSNPYWINLRFIEKNKTGNSYIFGESPLSALANISRKAKIKPGSVIFDVGCGWGRSTFFLHRYNKAHRSIGIDIIPEYIERAERIRKWILMDYMVFLQADIRKVNYSDADVVYFYATCLTKETVLDLIELWEDTLQDNTMVISTSWDLHTYSKKHRFREENQLEINYIWGTCTVFIYRMVPSSLG
jgi:cyclopropane fatty-acyl-phospholipid synthase-like methyltransferase